MKLKRLFSGLCCILFATSALAITPVETIRANLIKAGQTVDQISPSPVKGLYTVVEPQGVLYVDEAGTHVIQGQMYDMQTRENLTEIQQVASLPKVDWKTLPLGDAIKTVKGNGKRKLAVFSDPDCPYCHMLESKSLPQLNNVTIYTFLYPLNGLHPDATRKARLIWCAPDRAKAWDDWMHHAILPTNNGACETPLERDAALAQKLHINGTPGLIFANGTQLPGARQPDVIEKRLEAAQ